MIVRLHHVQITIPNGEEDRCRQFYCELLGLKEIAKPVSLDERKGFWLELGDVQIHVGIQDNIDRAASKAHLAYEVANLAEWRANLRARGIDVLDGVSIPGFTRFEFRDPFGNRVEFLAKDE